MQPSIPLGSSVPPMSFPYQQLLEYFEGRLTDPQLWPISNNACKAIRALEGPLGIGPRPRPGTGRRGAGCTRPAPLPAHVATRPVAIAPSITRMPRITTTAAPSGLGVIDPFCKAVALSDGMILIPVIEKRAATREGTWKAWRDTWTSACTAAACSCSVFVLHDQRQLGLPGPLLRDWLLREHYGALLDQVTNTIIKRVVVCVVFPTQTGFRAVEAEDRREELDQPALQRGRLDAAQEWNWEARSETADAGAVVRSRKPAPSLPRTLELSHTLAEGRGSLAVRFEIDDQGQFHFDVVLTHAPDEQSPRPAVTVEVILNEQVFTADGTGETVQLRPTGRWPAPRGRRSGYPDFRPARRYHLARKCIQVWYLSDLE